jgi:DNA topoisomerase VI subunit B
MKTVQLTTDGIRKHLDSTTPEQAIAEYIWNGLDAKAGNLAVDFHTNELGSINEIIISDDGHGIAHEDIERKFGVFLDSEKIKSRNTSKRISSETHGKDGIGRLMFFSFAQRAEWRTVYQREKRNTLIE